MSLLFFKEEEFFVKYPPPPLPKITSCLLEILLGAVHVSREWSIGEGRGVLGGPQMPTCAQNAQREGGVGYLIMIMHWKEGERASMIT